METLLVDIRYAHRALRRSPGFAAVAVLTLALGIGATTAIFSVLNAVVLQPLPFPDPDRLVAVRETTPDGRDFSTSEPNYLDFRERNRSFAELAVLTSRQVALLGTGAPERLEGVAVTPNYFPLLGAGAALGRTFLAEEEAEDARVVVFSHGLWERRFGSDPGIAGRSVELDGLEYTVVGVMPRDFATPGDPELWLPLAPRAHADRGDHTLSMIGRLAPGVDLDRARADLQAIADGLSTLYPETNGGWGVRLVPFRDVAVGAELTRTMWVLLGAVGLLLLLACANISNLLVARASARQREMSVRAALGAGRSRILRQLLTESLLLSFVGAAAGLVLAYWAVPLLKALSPAGTPRIETVRVDAVVLAFTTAITVATGVLFGLAPALQAARTDVHGALRQSERGASAGAHRLRDALVVGQVALAMMLLIGAGLLATSFLRLQQVDPGFDAEDVLAIPLVLTGERYTGEEMGRFMAEVERRTAALPGVVAVGFTNVEPLGGGGTVINLSVEGRPSGPGETYFARWRVVTPGFFGAAGVSLLRGRALERSDYASGAADVIVVTETLAERVFPGEDPLGRRVAMGVNGTNWRRIVGVVEDVQDIALAESPQPLFFFPNVGGWPWVTLLVRTSGNATALAPALRREIWAVDPDLPVPQVAPLEDNVGRAVAGPRFNALLVGAFAVAALILAALGIYGLMVYSVTRRTREIGVRMALGAVPGRIVALLVGRGAALAGAGVGIGMLAALWLTDFIEALLFETAPTEPATYAAVAGLLCLVAFLAVIVPARRAARVDPMVALRTE